MFFHLYMSSRVPSNVIAGEYLDDLQAFRKAGKSNSSELIYSLCGLFIGAML